MTTQEDVAATLDVNVLVSSLINAKGAPYRIVDTWRAGRCTHVTSEHIIRTFSDKISGGSLTRRFPLLSSTSGALLGAMRNRATIVTVSPSMIEPVTGDPEDDAVLATAVAGRAEYLVTGDKALLALGVHRDVRIVTPRDFIQVLER